MPNLSRRHLVTTASQAAACTRLHVRRPARQVYQAFRDQEPEINELEKLADLALYVCDQEMLENVQISERGSTAFVAVQQLRDRIANFRKAYYENYKT